MSGAIFTSTGRGRGAVFAACLAAGSMLQAADWRPDPARSIEFSDPKSSVLVTNIDQVIEVAPGVQGLEESIAGISSSMNPGSSLQGALLRPAPSSGAVTRNARSRGLSDPGGSGASLTAEEFMKDIALKEILKLQQGGGNGSERRSGPSLERLYYEQMLGGRSDAAEQSLFYDLLNSRRNAAESAGLLEPSMSRSDESGFPVNSIFERSPASLPYDVRPDAFLEGLRSRPDLARPPVSPEVLAQKARENVQMQRFRNLLDGVFDAEPLKPQEARPVTDPWLSSLPATPALPEPARVLPLTPNPIVNPALLPPAAPATPVASSLAPAPYTPPPSRTPAPKPVFSVQKRAF